MHFIVAEMIVNRLTPQADLAPEPVAPAPGLLRSLLSGLAARLFVSLPAQDRQEAMLNAEVERLAALSPHLLEDIGIDPVTCQLIEPEAVLHASKAPVQEHAPTVVFPVRQKPRMVRILPTARGLKVGALPA
ncbi:MAG: hypothetical protein LPJ95_06600 [Paracoccaceae bacterium]|nr:hypothetical protein [Paracoccaceae bacterium]